MRHSITCPFCGFLFNYLFAQDGRRDHTVFCPGCDVEIPRPETVMIFSSMRRSGDPYVAGIECCKEPLKDGSTAYGDFHIWEKKYLDPTERDWETLGESVRFLEESYGEAAAITVIFPK